eukprot:6136889-Amphidinium_carterae.1
MHHPTEQYYQPNSTTVELHAWVWGKFGMMANVDARPSDHVDMRLLAVECRKAPRISGSSSMARPSGERATLLATAGRVTKEQFCLGMNHGLAKPFSI